jgi:hypothetical protein
MAVYLAIPTEFIGKLTTLPTDDCDWILRIYDYL